MSARSRAAASSGASSPTRTPYAYESSACAAALVYMEEVDLAAEVQIERLRAARRWGPRALLADRRQRERRTHRSHRLVFQRDGAVPDRALEPTRPDLCSVRRADHPQVDANLVARAPDASFQERLDLQLA